MINSCLTSQAIVVYNNKILLLLRDNNPNIPNPNKWSTIGGEIEKGESCEEAFKRELYEEANIIPKNFAFLGMLQTPNGLKHAIFLVRLNDVEVKNVKLGDEGQELKFFSLDELKDIPLTVNLQAYFNKFGDELKKIIEKNLKINIGKIGLK